MENISTPGEARPYMYPQARPRLPVAGPTRVGCPRRLCCPRPIIFIMVLVLVIYIPLNVVYVISSTHRPLTRSADSWGGSQQKSLSVKVGDLVPGDNGKVNLVLQVDVQDLLRFMDNMVAPTGAATTNPLPRNSTILLHNPMLCANQKLDWFVYVHSSPGNADRRMNLRKTWANVNLFKEPRFKVVFLMGQTDDLSVKAKIREEFKAYGDLVIGDFIDHYKNLTLKGIMGLHWASAYCSNAPFVIKADDDAFVNIFEVLQIIDGYKSQKRLAVCPLWRDNSMPILRDPKKCMKWCVKYTEFPGRTHFPQYCAGLTYIMTSDLVREMYTASFSTPFFWIDDVYVTGLLMGKVKDVGYVNLIRNFTLKETVAMEQYSDLKQTPSLYFVHIKKQENFMKFWHYTLQRLPQNILRTLSDDVLHTFPELRVTPPRPSSVAR